MTKRPDEFDLFAQHLQTVSGGKGRRSDLFRWLQDRAVPFDKLLTEVRPSWKSVAAGLAALGVTDAEGKAPSPQCVRQTWYKVRRVAFPTIPTKPRTRSDHPPALPPPPVQPPMQVTHPTGPPEPVADDDPLAAIRHKMNKRSGRQTYGG